MYFDSNTTLVVCVHNWQEKKHGSVKTAKCVALPRLSLGNVIDDSA